MDATVGAPLVGARDGGAEKGDHEGRPYRSAQFICRRRGIAVGAATGRAAFVSSLCQTAAVGRNSEAHCAMFAVGLTRPTASARFGAIRSAIAPCVAATSLPKIEERL